MKSTELLKDAAFRVLSGDRQPGERIPQAMFRVVSEEIQLDTLTPDDLNSLREAMVDTERDPRERAQIVTGGLRNLRSQAYGLYDVFSENDTAHAQQEGEELTAKIVNGVVGFAQTYPQLPPQDTNEEFVAAFKTAFKPDGTPESNLRSAYVATEMLAPFLANRLVAVDWTSRESIKDSADELRRDFGLLSSTYKSIAPAIEHGFDADKSAQKDIAESLFNFGPLFAKTGQAFAGMAGAASNEKQAQFMKNVGIALQEGISMPTGKDIERMKDALPDDIEYESVISSASIAHVLKVTTTNGDPLAVKIKRANIEKSISDNIRTYQLLVDTAKAFVDAHKTDKTIAPNIDIITKALPFALELLENDIQKELNLINEAHAQNQAYNDFQDIDGVIIPRVNLEKSDGEHLFMAVEPSERIEDLPANPVALKNLMTAALQMWHTRTWHADLHPGNIKGRENGDIVMYDWAKPISLSPRFVRDIVRFVRSINSHDPDKVADAYAHIQSKEYNQTDRKDVSSAARDVFNASPEGKTRENKTIQQFMMTMGIRHQSTIDFNYANFMRSVTAFKAVVNSELHKPEYGGSIKRKLAMTKAAAQAYGTVYLRRRRG